MKWMFRFTLLMAFLVVEGRSGKDTNYYRPGVSNPNVNEKMYWRDSFNVLEDLSKFDRLYVKFHSCAWSPYGNGATGYNNGCGAGKSDGDGNADDDDDDDDDDDEEIENWYMGRTQCFRANAAYSLYGVLKGESARGCNPLTYINSFFTDYGVEVFSSAMGYAGVQNPEERYLEDAEEDDGEGDEGDSREDEDDSNEVDDEDEEGDDTDNENNGDDNIEYVYGDDYFNVDHGAFYTDENLSVNSQCYTMGSGNIQNGNEYGYSTHGQKNYGDYTSYGIGCSGKKFVRQTFQGAFCDGNDILEIDDELKSFNTAIQHASCVQIYSSTANTGSSSTANTGSYEDDDNDESEGEDEVDETFTVQEALDLLKYSSACSIREFPRECPDPYGKLSKYNRVIERATGSRLSRATEDARDLVSVVLLLSGLIMAVASFTLKRRKKMRGWRTWDVDTRASGITTFASDSSDSSSNGSFTTWRSGTSRLIRVGTYLSGTSSRVVKTFRKYAEAEDEDTFSKTGGASVYTESAPPSFYDTRLDARQPEQSISSSQNGDGHLGRGQFTGDGLAYIDASDSSFLSTAYRGRAQDQRNTDKQPATNTAMVHPMTLYRRNLVESRAYTDNTSSASEKVTKKDDYRPSSPSSSLLVATSSVATNSLSDERPPAPDRFVENTRFSPPVEVRLDRYAPPVAPVETGRPGQTEGYKPKKSSSASPASRASSYAFHGSRSGAEEVGQSTDTIIIDLTEVGQSTDSILIDLTESNQETRKEEQKEPTATFSDLPYSLSAPEQRKRYKRPLLARISKTLFRRRKWKSDAKDFASV
jgi:hypothetical protein